jgi:hypothetical protein
MITTWEIFGVYFGYPHCCIQWFVETLQKVGPPFQHANGIQRIASEGGFVPCPECARQLFLSESRASTLIKHRIDSKKFPQSDLPQQD